jgi:hypothetical protein
MCPWGSLFKKEDLVAGCQQSRRARRAEGFLLNLIIWETMAFPKELRRPPHLAASFEFFAGASSFLKRDPHGHTLSIFQKSKMIPFFQYSIIPARFQTLRPSFLRGSLEPWIYFGHQCCRIVICWSGKLAIKIATKSFLDQRTFAARSHGEKAKRFYDLHSFS